MEPIRLNIEVTKNGTAITGVEALASAIDTSIQAAAASAGSSLDRLSERIDASFRKIGNAAIYGFGSAFQGLESNLTRIETLLDRIEQKNVRLRGGGGGAGGAGGGAGGAGGGVPGAGGQSGPNAQTNAFIDSLLKQGNFSATGAQVARVNKSGEVSTTAQYRNPLGGVANYNEEASMATFRDRAVESISKRVDDAVNDLLARGFTEISRKKISNAIGESSVSTFADEAGRKTTVNRQTGNIVENQIPSSTISLKSQIQAQLNEKSELEELERNISAANQYLTAGNFKEVGRRAIDATGGVVRQYQDPRGYAASLNSKTGAFSADELKPEEVEKSSTLLEKLGTGVSGLILKGEAAWLLLQQIGSGIDALFIRPLLGMFKGLVDINDQFRKFEINISGIAGGLSRSKAVTDSIINLSQKSPLTISELQKQTQLAAYIPSFTSGIANRDPQKVEDSIDEFSRVASKLKFLVPEQTDEGVSRSLRNAYAGNYASLTRQFGIQKTDLAATVGLTGQQLTAQPGQILPALQKYLDSVVPDSAFNELSNSFGTRVEKLIDSLRVAVKKIGDAGIYDSLIGRAKTLTEQLNTLFDSKSFDEKSERISTSLNRMVDNLYSAATGFLQGASGASSRAGTPEQVIEQITLVAERLSKMSDAIVPVISALGSLVGAVIQLVGYVAEHVPDSVRSAAGQATDLQKGLAVAGYLGQTQAVDTRVKSFDAPSPADRFLNLLSGFGYLSPKLKEASDLDRAGTTIETSVAPGVDPGKIKAYGDYLFAHGQFDRNPLRGGQFELTNADQLKSAADFGLNRSATTGYSSADYQRRIAQVGDPTFAAQSRTINNAFNRFGEEQSEPNGYTKFVGQANEITSAGSGISAVIKGIIDDNQQSQNLLKGIREDILGDFRVKGLDTKTEKFDDFTHNIRVTSGEFDGTDIAKNKANQADAERQIDDFIKSQPTAIRSLLENYKEAEGNLSKFGTTAAKNLQILYDEIPRSVGQYAVGIANHFQESAQGSELLDPIIHSTSQYASDLAAQIDALRKLFPEIKIDSSGIQSGFGGLGVKDRNEILGKYIPARDQEIDRGGAVGGYISTRDLVKNQINASDYARRAGSPQDDYLTTQQRLAERQSNQALLEDNYNKAISAATLRPDDKQNIENLAKSKEEIDENVAAMRRLSDSLDYVKAGFKTFASEVRSALDNSVGEGIYNLIKGTGTLRQAFTSLADDITRAFSKMIANNIVTGLIGNLGQPQQNGQTGTGGNSIFGAAISGIGSLFGKFIGGNPSSGYENTSPGISSGGSAGYESGIQDSGFIGAKDGGIFASGWTPIHAYLHGGVIKGGKGQIGIIGEGGAGKDEGVVPLHGGSIPLRMEGDRVVASLPGGRSIPASFMANRFADGGIAPGGWSGMGAYYDVGSVPSAGRAGAGGGGDRGGRTYIIAKDDNDAVSKGYQPDADHIVRIVSANVAKGGQINQAFKRKNG